MQMMMIKCVFVLFCLIGGGVEGKVPAPAGLSQTLAPLPANATVTLISSLKRKKKGSPPRKGKTHDPTGLVDPLTVFGGLPGALPPTSGGAQGITGGYFPVPVVSVIVGFVIYVL
ncbi:hypothetical protein HA466_0276420 [Hirschfeldia incana]|nr:hypothetical protein HA466_0276420 [Hirschfeldia incana]